MRCCFAARTASSSIPNARTSSPSSPCCRKNRSRTSRSSMLSPSAKAERLSARASITSLLTASDIATSLASIAVAGSYWDRPGRRGQTATMEEPDAVLFDLDGTISDSATGIINGIKHAMAEIDLEVAPDHDWTPYLGPPLRD